MKKIIALALTFVMLMTLIGCGSDSGSSSSDSKSSSSGSAASSSGKSSDSASSSSNQSGGSGAIVGVTGAEQIPGETAQARTSWHAVKYQQKYTFDEDGKCLSSITTYYLDDPANYESANNYLEGGNWKPIWSSDKTSFDIEANYITYTTTDDAIADFEDDYIAYDITYADGGTKHVDAPDEATKLDNMKKTFGFSFDDFKDAIGDFEYKGLYKSKAQIKHGSNATVDDINALAGKAFEKCVGYADGGTMYTYLGKYGDVITEAPQITSTFDTAEFHYFRDEQEIKVSIGTDIKLDNALVFYVGIVK